MSEPSEQALLERCGEGAEVNWMLPYLLVVHPGCISFGWGNKTRSIPMNCLLCRERPLSPYKKATIGYYYITKDLRGLVLLPPAGMRLTRELPRPAALGSTRHTCPASSPATGVCSRAGRDARQVSTWGSGAEADDELSGRAPARAHSMRVGLAEVGNERVELVDADDAWNAAIYTSEKGC